MSHVNVGLPVVGDSSEKILRLGQLYSGVNFCRFDGKLRDGQSPYMKNMIFDKNLLRTRFGQGECEGTAPIEGDFHSVSAKPFFGSYVFHIGSVLCAFDSENLKIMSQDLPDCDSFIFEMNSKLYVFCSQARIFIADKDFVLTEHELCDVIVYKNAKYDLSEADECEYPDNMLLGRIGIEYVERSIGNTEYTVPTLIDESYPISFYNIDTKAEVELDYKIAGNVIRLTTERYGALRITYMPAKGEKYRSFDKIFGCRFTACYGGTLSGGTRVFFSGNPEYPGYYFHSELLEPLVVKELSYDILGNGSENINAFARQKSDLIAFCDGSVYRISYSFDGDTGPDFFVSQISGKIGCDMPGSVQLIDNRLVFASSTQGVFIIVSSDYTDELSIRSISANIIGTGDGNGLFSHDTSELISCVSVDFGRRYYLRVGSCAYVWDYGNTPYVVGSDPYYCESVLAWFYFEGITENSLFEFSGKLFGTVASDGSVKFVYFSDGLSEDFGSSIESVYVSREFDFSVPEAKKVLRELYFNVLDGKDNAVTVTVFADGEEIGQHGFITSGGDSVKERLCRLYMRVPGYEAYRFSVRISSNGGTLGIFDGALRVRSEGIYYR